MMPTTAPYSPQQWLPAALANCGNHSSESGLQTAQTYYVRQTSEQKGSTRSQQAQHVWRANHIHT